MATKIPQDLQKINNTIVTELNSGKFYNENGYLNVYYDMPTDDSTYLKDKPDVIMSLQEFKNNSYFMTNSNIKNRLLSELIYVSFYFHNIAFTDMLNVGDKISELEKLFSINTMDISMPGYGQNFTQQMLFNVIKNYNTGLDYSNKNSFKLKIIEDVNLSISRFLTKYFFINNHVDQRVLLAYPDQLKFSVFIYPLLYDADAGGILRFTKDNKAIIFDKCQFVSYDDWDFDISGSKADIVTKSITVNYEKMYVTE